MASRFHNPGPLAVITVPLADRDRAFLRSLRVAGGRMPLVTVAQRKSAEACRVAGYIQILDDGRTARLTGNGQAYLDLLARST